MHKKIGQNSHTAENVFLETGRLQSSNKEDPLVKRYFYKLSANLVGMALNFVTQAIILRGLGPKSYGDFNFLSKFFNEVIAFLDMGTSTCFYTKLSQRSKESGLMYFYIYFTGIISLFLIGFTFLAVLSPIHTNLWPDQEVLYIYLAAGMGIFAFTVQILNYMSDAYGLTVSAEIARILQKLLGVVIIIILYVSHQLNLANFFYYQYLILFFLGWAFIWIMRKNSYFITQAWILSIEHIKRYSREFYHYSHPLFIYALVGLVTGILDRWFLQVFSGSVQQGFFGFSYQIGVLCFLFTSAMTSLLTREFSIAFGNNDKIQMAVLFRRYIPVLYFITAFFSCFIALQADKVIYIIGGKNYREAVMVVTIMAFYPIHQTYGQLSGAVFTATGQTTLYRNIGVIFMLIGLPVTYFLLAPPGKMGINIGATGLAIKMVLLNIIIVNVQLYFNARFLKLSFWRYLAHQIFSVGCLLVLAALATFVVDKILGLREIIISGFLVAGFLYTLMVILLVYYFPVVFGIKKQDIQLCLSRIKG